MLEKRTLTGVTIRNDKSDLIAFIEKIGMKGPIVIDFSQKQLDYKKYEWNHPIKQYVWIPPLKDFKNAETRLENILITKSIKDFVIISIDYDYFMDCSDTIIAKNVMDDIMCIIRGLSAFFIFCSRGLPTDTNYLYKESIIEKTFSKLGLEKNRKTSIRAVFPKDKKPNTNNGIEVEFIK